jgi:hypothetical protein
MKPGWFRANPLSLTIGKNTISMHASRHPTRLALVYEARVATRLSQFASKRWAASAFYGNKPILASAMANKGNGPGAQPTGITLSALQATAQTPHMKPTMR